MARKEKKISISNKKNVGDKNSQYGTCWITNGIINKKIKKIDINQHIDDEWKLGRVLIKINRNTGTKES